MRSISALRRPKDSIALLESWSLAGGGGGEDDACELGAGDPGEWRLILVLATDLEKIEEIGRGGVDGNEIGIRRWSKIGKIGHFKVLRSLGSWLMFLNGTV